MDTSTIDKLLELGGQTGVMLVVIYYLSKTLKGSYEQRIIALEKQSDRCEIDRIKLRDRLEEILIKRTSD
tara:strand:- start:992 stop:1201 length:210 start_codon:yes stop_codon:yes gene_type:complete